MHWAVRIWSRELGRGAQLPEAKATYLCFRTDLYAQIYQGYLLSVWTTLISSIGTSDNHEYSSASYIISLKNGIHMYKIMCISLAISRLSVPMHGIVLQMPVFILSNLSL